MDDIQFQKNYSAIISPNYTAATGKEGPQRAGAAEQADGDFARLFRQQLQQTPQLTFSKHALQRMDSRQISISPRELSQISGAVEKAKAKGIKDALIVSGQTAFIVNVPSGTVVTTMSGREMADNIFTNIDGAVIL